MATRARKPSAPQCVVRIDYNDYLLPLAKGMQLVALMQEARKCETSYTGNGLNKSVLTSCERIHTEMEVVDPREVRARPEPKPDDLDDHEQF
ncbi:hypothetical protein FHW83_004711 [Duganella sp. SG902]|nr:hypothetical protein [Duganella sp. SG902]